MNVLQKVSSKISRQFSTLTTDASPSRPRADRSPTGAPFSPSEDPGESVEGAETPPVRPQRKKPKKSPKRDDGTPKGEEEEVGPENLNGPINTHASGSVINIINSAGIHWGPEITYNFGNTAKQDSDTANGELNIKKTKAITCLMESEQTVSYEHRDYVSKHIGSGWRSLARRLGYEDGMLDLLHETHQHKGVSEVIYQMLLDWCRTGERRVGQLTTALWEEGKRALVRDMAGNIPQ